MSSELHHLVYYSRNLVPGPQARVADEIESILASSRRNNSSVAITGALIFNSGIFAQVLEGTRFDIEATFERIQRDERHGEVQVLAFAPVRSRTFPSWSMGFLGRSRHGQDLFAHIGEQTGFDAKRMESERVYAIMRDLALEEEQRAA